MKWFTWKFLDGYRDLGLLILRVGLGLMMIGHGWPKMMGGPALWERLGGAMASIGIDAWPVFWGFMASFSETVGGALLVLGLATRPAALLLLITMAVAAANHLAGGDGFRGSSHAIEDGIAFLAIVVLGAGRYSIDSRSR